MGGKGGGGGITGADLSAFQASRPGTMYGPVKMTDEGANFQRMGINNDRATMGPKEFARTWGAESDNYEMYKALFPGEFAAAPVAAPAAAPAPVPAPAAPAPAVPAPAVPDAPVVPPTGTGNPIEQPTSLGNDLASTVGGQNFWVGGIDSTKNTKSGAGSLKTTQT
jgi:hypothetical protein